MTLKQLPGADVGAGISEDPSEASDREGAEPKGRRRKKDKDN